MDFGYEDKKIKTSRNVNEKSIKLTEQTFPALRIEMNDSIIFE
jgi:hypothetical protein